MKIPDKLTIENNFGLFFWVLVGTCIFFQIPLSYNHPQNLLILSIVISILIILYLIVKSGNLYSPPVLLAVLYVCGNIVFALFVKTILLQPLSSNLYAPVSSYFATLIAVAALFISLIISKAIKVGKPLFTPTDDPKF